MLPFITPPAAPTTRRVGNDRCGILELEVRGGLTVGESATIAELLAGEQSSFVRGAQIADAIRIKHAQRIEEVAVVYAKAGQRNIEATVTGLIRSRCNLPEWSLDDTRSLDKALFDGIWQLAQDEQAAEAMPTNPPSEDDLKKPQPVTAKRKAPTGVKSSGN